MSAKLQVIAIECQRISSVNPSIAIYLRRFIINFAM
jgi:hypothetical protein